MKIFKNLYLTLFVVVLLGFNGIAQEVQVTGTVTSEGESLPGVTILVKGTNQATFSDSNGNYTILNLPANASLVFSFIGKVTQEVIVGNQQVINVSMVTDAIGIDEVVTIGYGTQKKVNLTGAVATVNTKMIEDRPSENILKSLQGIVPGVTIISRPGGTTMDIRGRGNLGGSPPLYIVDGLEVSSDYFSNMEPSSIESISFLKDASSAAIYGAKAAFGVVLVTTKSGKKGMFQISYNGSYGVQSPTFMPKVLNSGQYAEIYTLAEINSGVQEANLTFSAEDIAKYKDGSNPDLYPNTNWFDLVLNENAIFTKHNLQFSGGGEKIRYVTGLGYMNDESLTPGEKNNRLNFSSKATADLKSWFTLTSNVNFIYKKFDRETGYANYLEFLRVPPTQVARHTNGEWGSVRNGRETTAEEANYNPLRTLEEAGRSNSGTKNFLGSLNAEIRPFEGAKIVNQIGYNYWDYRSFSFQNKKEGIPSFLTPSAGIIPGTASASNQMDLNWQYSEKLIYDGWLSYEKNLNQVHDISAVAGMHADSYTYKNIYAGRKDFASNDMNAFSGGSIDPDNQLTTSGGISEESMMSFFGRVSYNFSQKYLFEANFRADASSRFAKKGRWGYFPSFSAGWRLDQETFLSDFDWLSSLKLRASWGQNGNINNIGLYDTYSTFSTSGTTVIGGVVVPLVTEGRVGNPDLTWETTTASNLGLDFEINEGLLNMTLEYYNRVTDDILIRANDVSSETGLNSSSIPARNVGSVKNKGIELVISHRNKIGDFSYMVGGNMAINNNEILNLGENVDQLPPSSYWILRTGQSVGDFYMLEADGLYSTEEVASGNVIPFGQQVPVAGMVKYVDQLTEDTDGDGVPDLGDGVIDDKDRTIVANDVPSFTYGANIEVSYKNFTLSTSFQGITGVKVYLESEASQALFNNSVPREWQLDSWTPTNQSAQYPQMVLPTDIRYKYNSLMSSYWLFNASYLRIKNITLNYEIPSKITNLVGIEKARVYFSGDNLFTIRGDKRMKDFDPERSSGRGAQLNMKTVSTGISINF